MNYKLSQVAQNGKRGFSARLAPKFTGPSYPQSAAAEAIHNRSQFAEAELASTWPSLESIKRTARNEWTIPSLKAKIAELRMEHRQQLLKAIRYQVHEEQKMVKELYQTFDELDGWSAETIDKMKSLHRMERHLQMHQADDFVSRIRYIHIMALKPFYEKLQKLLLVEEGARAQRARLFPKSSQAWREMDTRDAKLKVAKFLQMDKKQQDDMINREPVWSQSKADVERVVLEFRLNIMFATEVKNFIKENQTTDPRRRAT
ncbi:hypothetical protein K439DRAFT_1177565 [Ramaria rubella]|nr:hypothetical protein K439DRAFT_1177565 [Ramaria rubella]